MGWYGYNPRRNRAYLDPKEFFKCDGNLFKYYARTILKGFAFLVLAPLALVMLVALIITLFISGPLGLIILLVLAGTVMLLGKKLQNNKNISKKKL